MRSVKGSPGAASRTVSNRCSSAGTTVKAGRPCSTGAANGELLAANGWDVWTRMLGGTRTIPPVCEPL